MSGTFRPVVFFSVFALLLPGVHAQSPLAPVPSPLLSAQKVFLANGGADPVSIEAFRKAAQVNEPYTSFYDALQSWGHWQLVSSPADADLVLVVRFTAPLAPGPSYSPQVEVKLVDGKTRFPLWTLTQPVEGAFRRTTCTRNYNDGIAALIGQLKTLTAPPGSATP